MSLAKDVSNDFTKTMFSLKDMVKFFQSLNYCSYANCYTNGKSSQNYYRL